MTDQVEDKIINRIRKLLATANGNAAGGEHERDTAMQMALKLLTKYNLSMSSVTESAQEKRLKETADYHSTPWMGWVANAIASMYFCKMYQSSVYGKNKKTFHFIGRESNVATTQEMVKYVISSIERESRRVQKERGITDGTWGGDFRKAAALKVQERCRDLRRQAEQERQQSSTGRELVLASLYKTELSANEAWLEQAGISLRTNKDRSRGIGWSSAATEGRAYGSSINLSKQVGGSSKNNPRLGN